MIGDPALARQLVLDELFDLSLYSALHGRAPAGLRPILAQLIEIERKHFNFWQEFFAFRAVALDPMRRVKLWLFTVLCRLFGDAAIGLALEAIEIYGVRKYLALWNQYRGQPLGAAVQSVLEDEFKHEDLIVSQLGDRRISPQRIRNLFFGFNDGLVEMLGAVSGLFAALGSAPLVLAAGASVAVAGSISMAAGAFAAASSEREVGDLERQKQRFLGTPPGTPEGAERPQTSAALVGASYLVGALVPLLPVALGGATILPSLVCAAFMVAAVSVVLSFLSGMSLRRRVLMNLVIVAIAAAVSYSVGAAARVVWGVEVP